MVLTGIILKGVMVSVDQSNIGGLGAKWQAVCGSSVVLPLAALLLLFGFNLIFTEGFSRIEVRDGRFYGTMIDIVQNGAPVLLMAVGMTLVIAVTGIDLSVGSVMALAGAVAAILITTTSCPITIAIAVALGVALLAGAWNGAMVTFLGVQPIIATLVMLVMGRGLAQALTDDQKVRFENPTFEWIGNGALWGIPVPLFVVAGVSLVALIALRKTVLGLYVEAIGTNAEAARLGGLPVHAIRLCVYGFCGLCAGAAGLIATADIKEADVANCGLYLELDAILAVVIGGTSLLGGRPRLAGSLCGALIMQTLTTMLQSRGVVTEHTLLIKAIVIVAVCAIQSPAASRLWTRARVRYA